MKKRIRSIVKKSKEANIMNKKNIIAILLVACFVFGVMVVSGKMARADSAVTILQPSQWTNGSYTYVGRGIPGVIFRWDNDMTGGFWDPANNFTLFVNSFDQWATIEANDSLPAAVRDWTVKQRELRDGTGRAEITVVETGTNAPAIVSRYDDFKYPLGNYRVCNEDPSSCALSWEAFLGTPGVCIWPEKDLALVSGDAFERAVIKTDLLVDYMYVVKFYIDSPITDPNEIIPQTMAGFFYDDSSQLISSQMILSGKGTLTNHAAACGFTPGKTAEVSMKMKWVNNTGGILKGHYPGRDFFPVENINIREVK